MLVIYPFHPNDQDQAAANASWIADLGTVQNHQCLIVTDRDVDPEITEEVRQQMASAFRHVVVMPLREAASGAKGMNLLFKRALRQVAASAAGHFLWMNPDAIPIRKGWLDAIEAAWKMMPAGKQFLGAHLTGLIPHMAAVGVYPQDAEIHAPNLVLAQQNPFNLNAAPQIIPKMAATDLIVDSMENPNIPWLTDNRSAVLYHGSESCKNGMLIHLLREMDAEDLEPLEIIHLPNEYAPRDKPGTFSVPVDSITKDNAARMAVAKAGSEGIPDEEMTRDATPTVSRVKPPVVNPLKGTPVVKREIPVTQTLPTTKPPTAAELGRESIERNERRLADQQFKITVDQRNVDMITKALAKFREKDAASKAAVLAALRAAGFHINGKMKGTKNHA